MGDTFSYDKSWENLERIVSDGNTPQEKWTSIIDFHETIKPKAFWTALRQIDIDHDIEELRAWLFKILSDSPPPESVIALWFGIIKLLTDEEKEVYAVYVNGSETYDIEDIEWATEPVYLPADRYFAPDGLNELDQLILNDEDHSFLDWVLPLALMSISFDMVLTQMKFPRTFKASCGHDSGDYINLRT